MCKYCGKYANFLLSTCEPLSTVRSGILSFVLDAMDKSRLLPAKPATNQQRYPQEKLLFLPLFEHIFYPVSTAPIIVSTR